MTNTRDQYAVIGAGPCGIAMVRCLDKYKIPFKAFEYHSEVGGIWNQENPLSTMYDSAHLISSKTMTQYDEFPFDDEVADYPSQKVLKDYFLDFASNFDLNKKIRFNSAIKKIDRNEDGSWSVIYEDTKSKQSFTEVFKGVILATGLFNKGNENTPNWPGMDTFQGKIMHASEYRSADIFRNKKVLVIGCGNSAADICIDAVHAADKVDISVRRGYYFVPKYIFGKPTDTVNGSIKKLLPGILKKNIDKQMLKWFAGDPVKFGFPKPEYDLFESHPVMNSLLLHHIGHGDIKVKKDVESFDETGVLFKDGSKEDYDIVLTATGYHLKFGYISKELLNWKKACPDLHLNIFHPEFDNLFVLGMIEATGIGWQGRYDQAELVSRYIRQKDSEKVTDAFAQFEKERRENNTDLHNGMKYIKLDRMAYYVHKEHYMNTVNERIEALS